MKQILTDRHLKSLKAAPAGKRAVIWDAALTSFGVRVTDRGVKTFFVMRRRAGHTKPSRVAIGTYPAMSLADARRKAGGALEALAAGEHPREREAALIAARARKQGNSFAAVAEVFIRRHVSKLRSRGYVESVIRGKLIPRWGPRPITGITRRDVIELVEEIIEQGHPRGAGLLLAYTRKLFNWALARDYGIENSPCDRVKASELIGTLKARQRVLTDSELRTIWKATSGTDYPLNPFIRLLLITGARRSEVARMTRNEVDFEAATCRLEGDRTKNEDPRVLPLSALALETLRALPEWTGPFLFSTTSGHRPISGFSKMKTRLGRRMPGMAAWRLHDLRRTMRTHLGALGVSPFIGELAIGHRKTGVHAVYDLHRYEAEIRDAMDKWAARLWSIVEPPPQNVVLLRPATRG